MTSIELPNYHDLTKNCTWKACAQFVQSFFYEGMSRAKIDSYVNSFAADRVRGL